MQQRELHCCEESIEYFKKDLSINPNHIAALLQMSYSLCNLKRYEEALTNLDKVIAIAPDWYVYMDRAAIKKMVFIIWKVQKGMKMPVGKWVMNFHIDFITD